MLENRTDAEGEFYHFSDLVDIDAFSQLLESFFKATGIPNGLVDPEGELLTQAGWCDACTLFHRSHPETNRFCQESNFELMQKLREKEVAGSLCKNGLYDYATPVMIEGHQLATLFLGQVLEEAPNLELFRQRAGQFGYDVDAYLEAIRAIPIVSRTQMEAHMEAMAGVTQILAANGLARLRETRLRLDLNRSTERRIQLEDLLKFSPVGISWCDAEGTIEYVNHQFTELFGYTLEDLPDIETWISMAYPNAEYRKEIFEPWIQQLESARHLGFELPELESNITCKDGRERRVMTRANWVGEKRLASFTDISAHWQSEQRNRAHNAMLEMVAKAEPLFNILYSITQAIEEESPSSLCSVMLLDEERKHLLAGAAPSLPSFYIDAVNGMEIGMGKQSCGTAAYLGKRVIVEDISTHEYWRDSADLAKQAGLAACWSEPIIASDGKVLGTFAIFHTEPAKPSLEDIERITFAANLAAIAIENRHTREALIRSERDFRTLADNAPVNIARYDRDGHLIYANPKLTDNLKDLIDQCMDKRLDKHSQQPCAKPLQKMIDQTISTGEENSIEALFSTSDGGEVVHHISMVAERDESGSIVGVLATGLDISERKKLYKELERQARLDFLTGLLNRRYFFELAKMELLRLQRYGGELSLIMFDIDRFKEINDTHGHKVGDLVLQKIAQVSRETIREVDIIARLGGEEFVMLLPNTNKIQAVEAAERLRLALANGAMTLKNGKPLYFTASFGVVTMNKDSEARSIDELLIRADRAMYRAKKNGRNRICEDFINSEVS
jgi:diguanylate cyclase (GGDEF)-like protein/PAS domain S-box-containing protein